MYIFRDAFRSAFEWSRSFISHAYAVGRSVFIFPLQEHIKSVEYSLISFVSLFDTFISLLSEVCDGHWK